jgi:hypothetical protein
VGCSRRRTAQGTCPAGGEPCIRLREAVPQEVAGGLEDVSGHAAGVIGEAVALEAFDDDPVVVRPDRPQLMGERIVGRLVRAERPDAPAAPHVGATEPRDDLPRLVRIGDQRDRPLAWRVSSFSAS